MIYTFIFMDETTYQWLSIIGSVASIIGIPFTLFQVWRVKTISKGVLKEFNKADAISDISKCNELINEAVDLLKNEQLEEALTNMKSIKSMIIQMKVIVPQFELSQDKETVEYKIGNHIEWLQNHINTIHKYHKTPQKINTGSICSSLDEIANYIIELQARISNRITH